MQKYTKIFPNFVMFCIFQCHLSSLSKASFIFRHSNLFSSHIFLHIQLFEIEISSSWSTLPFVSYRAKSSSAEGLASTLSCPIRYSRQSLYATSTCNENEEMFLYGRPIGHLDCHGIVFIYLPGDLTIIQAQTLSFVCWETTVGHASVNKNDYL